MRKNVLSLAFLLLLTGCAGVWLGEVEQDVPLEGDRIEIISSAYSPDNYVLEDGDVLLEPMNIPAKIKRVWSVKAGTEKVGYGNFSSPVIDGDNLYNIDNRGRVSCINKFTGRKKWRVIVARKKEDFTGVSGGGISIGADNVVVSTGFGDIFSLDKINGGMIWKYSSIAPFNSAPYIGNGVVFATNRENEMVALDEGTGDILWKHKGTPEEAAVLATLQIAGNSRVVIPTYTSGEVFALMPQNGREIWTDTLSVMVKNNKINTISDISASSVMVNDVLVATGLGRQTVGINTHTGERKWQNKLKSIKTPVVIDEYFFILTEEQDLIALSAETGGVFWKINLKDLYSGNTLNWSDMSIYKNHIVINNSMKEMLFISILDGSLSMAKYVGSFSFSKPVLDQDMLYIKDPVGKITAFKLY